jgi:hypothetical protein
MRSAPRSGSINSLSAIDHRCERTLAALGNTFDALAHARRTLAFVTFADAITQRVNMLRTRTPMALLRASTEYTEPAACKESADAATTNQSYMPCFRMANKSVAHTRAYCKNMRAFIKALRSLHISRTLNCLIIARALEWHSLYMCIIRRNVAKRAFLAPGLRRATHIRFELPCNSTTRRDKLKNHCLCRCISLRLILRLLI